MKQIIYIALAILFFTSQQVSAVPAYPHPIQYKQPDGSVITIMLKGDERVHWATTFEGYTLLVNKTGFYEYAQKDAAGDLTLSGIRVHNVDKRTSDEKAFLQTAEKDLRYSREQVNLLKQVWETQKIELTKSSASNRASYAPATGTVRAPLVLVGFMGKPFTKTKEDFDLLMNQPNYTANGTIPGSVRDYFYDNSYGQLTYQVDVFGPYTLSHPIAYYDQYSGGDPRAMTYEAANKAHDDGCNFADYDTNADGYVDGIHIIFAGYGQEASAPAGDAIWSHSWELFGEYELQLDGKQILRYSCSPELRDTYGSNITYIGVIAHELSHVFGILDFYDTDYSQQGQSLDTGNWDIMAHGSWNDQGRTPANHTAWSKDFLGWVPAVELTSEANITLPDPATQGAVYKINTTTPNEYFLIENRQQQGWDAYIPSSGMLIYHADENYSGWSWDYNCINCVPEHRGFYVKQAGGGVNSNNSNRTTDPYPSGGNTAFTDVSVPNSKSWAGATTDKPVTRITHNTTDHTVSFKFMENPEDYDAALTQFVHLPAKSYQAGEREIKVDLENWGKAFTSATITWSIDNQEQTPYQWTGSLIYNKKETVTLGVADLPVGIHTISATVILAGDVDATNNTLNATIEIKPAETLPYTTEFNGSLDGWESVSFAGDLDWQWSNAPDYFGYMSINTTTRANGYALYGIIRDGAYIGPNPAQSALISPGFDFSNVENAIDMSFEYNVMMYYTQTTLKVQASTDNFQNQTIDIWSQTLDNPWANIYETPKIDLSAFAGESNVQIRFLFNGGEAFAWAIDDVKITINNEPRLKTLTVSSGELSPAFNPAISNYTVKVINEVSSIDIAATAVRQTDIITGTGTKSLVEGNNSFEIVVRNQDGNDSKTYTLLVKRMGPVLHIPFTEDFESGAPSWTIANGDQPNQWFIGTGTAASGTHSAYISKDGGLTNSYYGSQSNLVYLFSDVYFTPHTDTSRFYQLSFDWKLLAESYYDYLTVYLVDTDTEPIAGEGLYNAIYLGEFKNANPWQRSLINISGNSYSSLQGETKRLVFAWYNDRSWGDQPPIAIDNIKIQSVNTNEALLSSLTVSSGTLSPSFNDNTFNYTVNLANNVSSINIDATTMRPEDIVSGTGTKSLTVGDNPFEIEVSNPEGTVKNTYRVVVKRRRPTLEIPFIEDFESETPYWNMANGTQPNQWVIGTATAASGTHSIYISNDGGVSNIHTPEHNTRVYFYSDIYFTPYSGNSYRYRLSFDWKGACCDLITVYLADIDTEPVAGQWLNNASFIGQLRDSYDWQEAVLDLTGYAYPGETKRLVFLWSSDRGDQPPAAIDNIKIQSVDPYEALLSNLTVNNGTLSPYFDPNTFNYTVTVINNVSSIDINASTWRPVDTVSGTGTKSLEVGDNPFEIVVSNPEGSVQNIYTIVVTRLIPRFEVPFTEDFESETTNWQFANGTQTNQWVIGEATAASGTHSAYISDDEGFSNHYTGNNYNWSYLYCDVYFTPHYGYSNIYQLSFDWKGMGAYSSDYLNVYMVDTNVEPVAGVSFYGREYNLGQFWNSEHWQKAIIDISSYSLSDATQRLVFLWYNNSYNEVQPPIAIDNISIRHIDNIDTTLRSLTVDQGVLSPAFDPFVYNYTVDVANSVSNIALAATPSHPSATVAGANETFSLNVGANTFNILVASANRYYWTTYTVKVNRANGTGIENPVLDPVRVYPNPTSGIVQVENANGAELKVFNALGELILQTDQNNINLSGYPNGVYFLRVNGETVKIMKQ